MTSTPRTDAVAYDAGGHQHDDGAIVPADFARGLERELAERKRVGDELARCAGQLGWTSADQPEWCRRAEVAVNAWRSLP